MVNNRNGGQITGGQAGPSYGGAAVASGGIGLLAGAGTTINNAGTIYGGFGSSSNSTSPGGIGIVGSGLTINNTGGTISGGLAYGGFGARALAIQFTGGTNAVGTGGTINGGINVLGGSFQPALNGTTPGTTLAVSGPISFATGTFYNVRITPTDSDSVTASGAGTLGGAGVRVNAGQGTYQARQYTILTAQVGFIGPLFSSVSANFAFLTPTLSYTATQVLLNIQAGTAGAPALVAINPVTGAPIINPVTGQPVLVPNYTSAAVTQNQFNIATGLTNAGVANGGTGKILTAFNQLTVAQAQAAFDSVSGEGITAAQNVANRSAQAFNAAIFDQTTFYGSGGTNSITLTAPQPGFFAYAPQVDAARAPIHELADLPSRAMAPVMPTIAPARTWRAWGSGFGGVDNLRGNSEVGSASQTDSLYGGALGVDYQLTPDYLVGVAVGGSDGYFSVPGRTTSGETTGGHIAVYDLATFGKFYGASSNSFSYFTNRTTRATGGFGGLAGETDRGSFDSYEFRSRLEFGRHFDGFGGTVTPFIALELADLRSNGFNETAVSGPGLLALNVSGQSSASVPSFVGARFQSVMLLGGGMSFSPTFQAAYVHEFAPQRTQFGSLVNLPGSTFLVDGARPSRNAGQAKFGGELALNAHSILFANFDGEFSGVNQFYGGHGGFKYVW